MYRKFFIIGACFATLLLNTPAQVFADDVAIAAKLSKKSKKVYGETEFIKLFSHKSRQQVSEVLGKPADALDAERILRMLSGKSHEVLTAVALTINPNDVPIHLVQISEVRFAELTDAQIQSYIETKEPFGKAGAYGIQGGASAFILEIKGSYSGIMGLPLYETALLLDRAQVQRI